MAPQFRLLCLLLPLILVGCSSFGPPRQPQVAKPKDAEEPSSRRPLVPAESTPIALRGEPEAAFTAVLRSLVRRGFEITLNDSRAGVLTAQITRVDSELTDKLNRKRRNIYNNLTYGAQARLGPDSHLKKEHIVRRKLTLSIVVEAREVVVTPRVIACLTPQNDCLEKETLITQEVEDVAITALEIEALNAEADADAPQRAKSQAAPLDL